MNSSFAKRIFDVIGIIAGILIIVYGVKLSDNGYYGTLTSDAIFGADFYTEQYAATKHAAETGFAMLIRSYKKRSLLIPK